MTEAMEAISAVVEENSAATEQMAAQSQQVSSAIESIAAVAADQSHATDEVSSSAEAMNAQVGAFRARTTELAQSADQLRGLGARFELGHETSAQPASVVPLRRAA